MIKLIKGPKILVFFITYRCNSRCIMCHIWEKQNTVKEMNLEEIAKIFQDHLLKDSLEIINITGGEPTLRPDLREIIKILIQKCPNLKRIDMPTNGIDTDRVLDKTEQILALLFPEQKIRMTVTVSIDGINEIYERVRNVENGFERVKKTVVGLKELANLYPYMSLNINTVITKANYNHLEEILKFAKNFGLGINFTLGAISEIGVESIKKKDEFMMNEEEKKSVSNFIKTLNRDKIISGKYANFLINLLLKERRIFGCSFRQRRAVLLEPDGNIYLCGNFKKFLLGNVIYENFYNIWQNGIFTKRDWRICRRCESNCYF